MTKYNIFDIRRFELRITLIMYSVILRFFPPRIGKNYVKLKHLN